MIIKMYSPNRDMTRDALFMTDMENVFMSSTDKSNPARAFRLSRGAIIS